MKEFMLLLGMFAVTFGVRYPVLALVSRTQLPVIVAQALKFVPPTVLTAIIVPAVLIPDGENITIDISNAPMIASVIAVFVAWRTKNLLFTILAGMGTLWLWQWLV